MSGTVASQVIPILAMPFLTRIYSPSDYGVLAFFLAVTSIVNILSTLNFPVAIFIPKEVEEAKKLFKLSVFISFLMSIFMMLLVVFLGNAATNYFSISHFHYWFYLIPVVVLVYGINFSISTYASRLKKFSIITKGKIYSALFSTAFSLSMGLLIKGPAGLIYGFVINYITMAAITMIPFIQEDRGLFKGIFAYREFGALFFKYKNFPLYNLPADLIMIIVYQLPVFILGRVSSAYAGFLGMSNRVLGMPVTFITTSFAEVFRQKAAEEYNAKGNCKVLFIKTLKTLFLIAIVPFSIFALFAPSLFSFVFGEKWEPAGHYAQIMTVLFFARFMVLPFVSLYNLRMKQKEDFLMHLYTLTSSVSILIYFGVVRRNIELTLLFFSLNYTLIYLIYLIRSFQFSKKFE